MPIFETKDDLVSFFKVLTDNLDKNLGESGFELSLNISAINMNNTDAIMDAFKTCQKAGEKKIVGVKGNIPNPLAKKG